MPYAVECPSCGKQKLLPARVPGKLITCLDCKTRWTISASGTATIQAPAAPKYACFTCGGSYDVEDVYDQDGGIICHACYEGQMQGLVVHAVDAADEESAAAGRATGRGRSPAARDGSVVDRKPIRPPPARGARDKGRRVMWIVLVNTGLAAGLAAYAVHLYQARLADRDAGPVAEVVPTSAEPDWETRNAPLIRQLIAEAAQAQRDHDPREQLVKLQQLHDLVNHQLIGDRELEREIFAAMNDWRRLSAPLNHPKVAQGQAEAYTAQP